MSLDRTKRKLCPTPRQERARIVQNLSRSKLSTTVVDVRKLTDADHAKNPKLQRQLQEQKRRKDGGMTHASAGGVLPEPISQEEHNSALLEKDLEINNLKREVNELRKKVAHFSNTLGITVTQIELYDVD